MGSYKKTLANIIGNRTGKEVLGITNEIKERRRIRLSQITADKNITRVTRRY